VLVEYLTLFPLMGSKRLNYQDWARVHLMIVAKQHLTVEGKQNIKQLKLGINKGRNTFYLGAPGCFLQ